jgi:hypothetical protein
LRTTTYRASTNGVVERFHRTLNSMLGKMVSETQRNWDRIIPQALAAYRATEHSATGFTPNRLFLGRESNMPADLVWGAPERTLEATLTRDEYVEKIRENTESAYKLAREQLRASAERRKTSYDVRVKKSTFATGDWVWYYYPRKYQGRSPKWQKLYTGPYLVLRAIPPVNFVLQKSQRSKPFVVHIDKLKRCFGETPKSWLTTIGNDVTVSLETTEDSRLPSSVVRGSCPEPMRTLLRQPTQRKREEDHRGDVASLEVDDSRPRRNRRPPAHLNDFRY